MCYLIFAGLVATAVVAYVVNFGLGPVALLHELREFIKDYRKPKAAGKDVERPEKTEVEDQRPITT